MYVYEIVIRSTNDIVKLDNNDVLTCTVFSDRNDIVKLLWHQDVGKTLGCIENVLDLCKFNDLKLKVLMTQWEILFSLPFFKFS